MFTNYIQKITDTAGITHDLVDTSASHYIKGTQTASTNVWIGDLPDGVTAYYDGLMIDYFLPYAGTSTAATLNLGGLGAKPIYRGNSPTSGTVTTHYPVRSVIHMTYVVDSNINSGNGAWIVGAYYDSDSNTVSQAHCVTAAATAAKAATLTYYTATANSYCMVLMRYTNTSKSALTLNINSQGAKPIYINGAASSTSNYTLPAGSYLVFYDGTNYYFRTDGKITGETTEINAVTSIATTSPITGGTITTTGTIGHANSGATAGSYGDSAAQTPAYGGTFKVPYVTVNATGHVTEISEHTVKIPASDNTDTKVTTAAITSGTTYYPILATGAGTATRQIDTTGFIYKGTNGTTSAVGSSILTLGNSTASGTANNKQGKIILYGSTAYAHTIQGAPTAARTLTLPDATGTIALTSQIPTVSYPVTSVNSKTGAVSLTYSDVGAAASSHGTHVSYGTSATAIGTSSAGSATTVSRSDHVHSISLATGDSNGQVKIAGTNVSVKGLGSAAYTASTAYASSSHTHTSIGDGTMAAYAEQNNEFNFGGSYAGDTIYIGYREKDSKSIPSKFVFGGGAGSASLQASMLYLSGSSSYITGSSAGATSVNGVSATLNGSTSATVTGGDVNINGTTVSVNLTSGSSSYFSVVWGTTTMMDLNYATSSPYYRVRFPQSYSFSPSGSTVKMNSSGAIGASGSSKRRKTDISYLIDTDKDPEKLYGIKFAQFRYKKEYADLDSYDKDRVITGLIAEDLDEIYPIGVYHDNEGLPADWDEHVLIPAALELIRRQHLDIENQKQEIKGLNEKIELLESKIDKILY